MDGSKGSIYVPDASGVCMRACVHAQLCLRWLSSMPSFYDTYLHLPALTRTCLCVSCGQLCPRWLKFVKGVVDSEDLPLNVGREILQKSSVLRVVSRRIVKKCLDMFSDLKEKGGEDWDTFQKNFGKYLKVGVVEDNDNRQDIGEYICFQSTAHPSNLMTLTDYVARMKEGQECIYFVSGEGRAQCEMAPALEKVKSNDFEVIFCTEPLDELCMMELKEIEGKEIVDLSKDSVKGIDDNEDKKKEKEEAQTDFAKTCSFLVQAIGDKKISKAEVSTSLSDSPAVLAQAEYGMSPQMQKYMKARAVAMGDDMDFGGPVGQASVLQVCVCVCVCVTSLGNNVHTGPLCCR